MRKKGEPDMALYQDSSESGIRATGTFAGEAFHSAMLV